MAGTDGSHERIGQALWITEPLLQVHHKYPFIRDTLSKMTAVWKAAGVDIDGLATAMPKYVELPAALTQVHTILAAPTAQELRDEERLPLEFTVYEKLGDLPTNLPRGLTIQNAVHGNSFVAALMFADYTKDRKTIPVSPDIFQEELLRIVSQTDARTPLKPYMLDLSKHRHVGLFIYPVSFLTYYARLVTENALVLDKGEQETYLVEKMKVLSLYGDRLSFLTKYLSVLSTIAARQGVETLKAAPSVAVQEAPHDEKPEKKDGE